LELETAEFQFGVTNKSPDYLAKFPLGKIPAFEAPDGLLLTESNAIANYVAEKSSKAEQLLGGTPERRAQVNQWVFFNELQVEKSLAPLCYMRLGFMPPSKETETVNHKDLVRWLDMMEKHMKGREGKWLLDGDALSMADLAVCGALGMGFQIYIDAEMRKDYPALVKYFEKFVAVPELKDMYKTEMVEKKKELAI